MVTNDGMAEQQVLVVGEAVALWRNDPSA